MVMKVYISTTVVECGPSEKTFNEKLYRREIVLTPGAPLLIVLLDFYLLPSILQFNHRTPADHLICTTIISTKGWFKKILIKRNLRPGKDQKKVIEQQPAPSSTVIKSSGILQFLGRMTWVNILLPSLNQCRKILLFF